MKKFNHFCLKERQRIERYLNEEKSLRFIADKLDRSISSVSREIKENSVNGMYDATKAQHRAYIKRRNSKIQCLKIATNKNLRDFVENNIKQDQSPESISGRLKHIERDIPYASLKAIYKYINSVYGRKIEKHLYSKAVKKKGGPKRGISVSIDGRIMIDKRPKKAEERIEFGHYELDFIESGKDGKGHLLVIVERKTRYPFLKYLENKETKTVNGAVTRLLNGYPVLSITTDNDISLQKHQELSEILDAMIFFCHAQAPHEKGTVENRNKAIRRYIKKKSDLSKYPESAFKMVEDKLRNKYMKCLEFRTPKEMFELELQKQKKPLERGLVLRENILIDNLESVLIEG